MDQVATAIKAALAEVRPQRGVIQRVAEEIGTTRFVLSNLMNGRTKPSSHPEVINALRKRFKKPESWPFTEVSAPAIPVSRNEVAMPYAGKISAGVKVNWTDPYETDDIEYVPASMTGRGRFCCRIEGDSMFDFLQHDDVCVFQSHPAPRPGLIVLYRSKDLSATIKQLKHDGRRFLLHALNPAYDDVEADGQCFGYLVGIVRKWHTFEMTLFDSQGLVPENNRN